MALKWSVCEKFSHWLRDTSFMVWTDNNPLTYIMTKPKLDACEQRWVAKLAPYTFSLKHIAGTKNIVADALSRDPFTRTVGQRLITECYDSQLTESDEVGEDGVQDAFRLMVQCSQTKGTKQGYANQSHPLPLCNGVVKALLDAHDQWDYATECRAAQLVQSVQHLVPPGRDLLPTFSLEELRQSQELDPSISKLVPFLSRKRRPSRRERDGLDTGALVLIKQWERLKVLDGVLYRVIKDPLSKQKRQQFVLP